MVHLPHPPPYQTLCSSLPPPTMLITMCAPSTLLFYHVPLLLLLLLPIHSYLMLCPTGRNPYCIDKNYGESTHTHTHTHTHNNDLPSLSCAAGVLIIWDRMFGTFQPEREKVIYGLVHPLGTWDPFWAQVGISSRVLTFQHKRLSPPWPPPAGPSLCVSLEASLVGEGLAPQTVHPPQGTWVGTGETTTGLSW